MSQPTVVSIGGIDYDSRSGLPVTKNEQAVQRELQRVQSVHAKRVHQTHQRSHTLNRRFVKKTESAKVQPVAASVARPSGIAMDMRKPVKRSPQISKFARHPQAIVAVKQAPAKADIGPMTHASVAKAHAAQTAVKSSPAHTHDSQHIKQAAIGHAMKNAAEQPEPKQPKRRALNVAVASLGVLLLTGYFTYVNMPNLSVRVAAAQAGIDAAYPDYRPVGYRLNGPVAYQDGQVSMKFASNSGPLAFAFNQSRSSWDSSALLEKYVDPRSNGKYATYNDAGLTIYTYGTDAAWVNGGVLYTVEGTATLSNEQIRRIATSM